MSRGDAGRGAGALPLAAHVAGELARRNGATAVTCDCGATPELCGVRDDSARTLAAAGWRVRPAPGVATTGARWAEWPESEGCTCLPF